MTNNGRIIFGATVTLLNVDTEEEQKYRIVGDDEANIKRKLNFSQLTDCPWIDW